MQSSTLGKSQTRPFFLSDTGYADLEARWRSLLSDPDACPLRREHHALYAILRGKDWVRGFTPITNSVKLANGQAADRAVQAVRHHIHSRWSVESLLAPFNGLLSPDALVLVRAYVRPKGTVSYDVLPTLRDSPEAS